MSRDVNLRFTATNRAGAAMKQVQRGLSDVNRQIRQQAPLQRSWNAGLNSNRRAVQQFGFQMSDFAIQIAGGQSAMLAFTQQGGQMLQFFGPAGALSAAFLAVFGSLAIGISRAGLAMEDLYRYFGVLEGDVRGIVGSLSALTGAFSDLFKLILDELDTVIIALTVATGMLVAKWVRGVVIATATTGVFSNVLRATALSYSMFGVGAAAATLATSTLAGAMMLLSAAAPVLIFTSLVAAGTILVKRFLEASAATSDLGTTIEGANFKTVKYSDAVETLTRMTEGLRDSSAILSMSMLELSEKYGTAAEKVREFAILQAEIRMAEANRALREQVMAVKRITDEYSSATNTARDYSRTIVEMQDNFGVTRQTAINLASAIASIGTADTFEKQTSALAHMREFMELNNISVNKLPPALADTVSEMINLHAETSSATQMVRNLAATMQSVSNSDEDSSVIGSRLSAWKQYYNSRNVGAWLVAREGVKAAEHSRTEDARIMSSRLSAWNQYYNSRIAGERLLARASESYAKTVGRGRGADPRMFSETRDEFRRQMAAQEEFAKSMQETVSGLGRVAGAAENAANRGAAAVDNNLTPAMERLKSAQDMVASKFESGMMSMVDGTKSVADAFRSMASEIIKELYRIFVVKQITGMISDFVGGMGGAPTTSPRPIARPASFAGGGYTGNGARAGGLDGKGGYMAMVHPRETVVDHTKGGGGTGMTVNINNTFAPGVSRAEFDAQMPKMIEATKAAVADAARRGGSFGKAFG